MGHVEPRKVGHVKSLVLNKHISYITRLSQMAKCVISKPLFQFCIVVQGTPTHGSRCPAGGAGLAYEKK